MRVGVWPRGGERRVSLLQGREEGCESPCRPRGPTAPPPRLPWGDLRTQLVSLPPCPCSPQTKGRKEDKGEGAGPGWQTRERKRELQKRHGTKGGAKGGAKGGSGLKLQPSAINKQRKILKERKQVALRRIVTGTCSCPCNRNRDCSCSRAHCCGTELTLVMRPHLTAPPSRGVTGEAGAQDQEAWRRAGEEE